ncbi:phosphatidylserine decarboxylase, partial [Lecanoromycetidae sp. Uapishka_2]
MTTEVSNRLHRTGHWLPQDPEVHQRWLDGLISDVDKKHPKPLKPEIQEFQDLIEGDITLKVLVSLMFQEVPIKEPYNNDPEMQPQVRDYKHMLKLIDHIMDSGPKWSVIDGKSTGLIGFPINAILDWPMGTYSGNAFFLRPEVQKQFGKILKSWEQYLSTSASLSVLTDAEDGWLSGSAINELKTKGNNDVSDYTFEQLYVCEPSLPYHGFSSWDSFFIREFREGIRPLEGTHGAPTGLPPFEPENAVAIYNACESCPVFLRRDVHYHAPFWLKGQKYSLGDMMNHDTLAHTFVGGTIYQAFLSALSYHRWHSPISGTIVKKYNVEGSYYSENYFQGFANTETGPDPAAPDHSQAYITGIAARAVIVMMADDPAIGLMGLVFVGMCEVSSNEITVEEDQHVNAGDQLGMFHFGGSTHCLIFRKEVDVKFALEPNNGTEYNPAPDHNMPLRSIIAVVKKSGANGA